MSFDSAGGDKNGVVTRKELEAYINIQLAEKE